MTVRRIGSRPMPSYRAACPAIPPIFSLKTCPRPTSKRFFLFLCLILGWSSWTAGQSVSPAAESIVFTQIPHDIPAELLLPRAGGMLRADLCERGRIVRWSPGKQPIILSRGFQSACDPEVSFDGKRVLFAGKKNPQDVWNIFEVEADGSTIRQITRESGNARSPVYLSTLYTLDSPEPWYQIGFTSDLAGELNEFGPFRSSSLYSCRMDGSELQRLTFNPSSDLDPVLLPDGRILFAGWQRATLERGLRGRFSLFGVNIDGTDLSLFSGDGGRMIRHMACVTDAAVVFVEADELPWDGAGQLAAVSIRRPLHSYRAISAEMDGVFHSPSPWQGEVILVSRRPRDNSATHGIYRLDMATGKTRFLFDDPGFHDLQAKVLRSRTEPDGRSSVVSTDDPTGELYALDVRLTDIGNPEWLADPGNFSLRVLEGVPLPAVQRGIHLDRLGRDGDTVEGSTVLGIPPLIPRRILGEVPLRPDGSVYIRVPANTPLQLQLVDPEGMALRSCAWIWVRNREARGCIGCHEDGELTPPNRLADAVTSPPIPLTLPPHRRRVVDFNRDVMPLVEAKCGSCHGDAGALPLLVTHNERSAQHDASFNGTYLNLLKRTKSTVDRDLIWEYIDPGSARSSPLIWHLYGKNTSRPWDDQRFGRPVRPLTGTGSQALTAAEKRVFVEWIDLGALWRGFPPR